MAHSLSAKKRVRQNLKRQSRNKARKAVLKDQTKAVLSAIAGGDFKKAEDAFRKATSVMDRVASKGTIHKKTAARKRSRLALRLNAAKAGKGTTAATSA